jgi:DNA-binding transcriptional regulator/RsmH inhibitor MraZ
MQFTRFPGALLAILISVQLAACAPMNTHAPAPSSQALAPQGLWRFALCDAYCALVDAGGKPITNRLFDKVESFSDLSAEYRHGNERGVIDNQGHTIIKPGNYSELLKVGLASSQWLACRGAGTLTAPDASPSCTLFDEHGNAIWYRSFPGLMYATAYGDQIRVEISSADKGSRTLLLDGNGVPRKNFAALGQPHEGLAIASIDGKHFGYVDADTLEFVIAPTFVQAEPFLHGYASVITPDGAAVIDRHGNFLVPSGKYRSIFPRENYDGSTPRTDKLFTLAYPIHNDRCGEYLQRDWRPVALPPGICPGAIYTSGEFGYVSVRDKGGLYGMIDRRGRLVIPPHFKRLMPLNDHYLAFSTGDDSSWGIIDIRGRIVMPPQKVVISRIYVRQGVPPDVFIGQTPDGNGLIDPKGRWRVPPKYGEPVSLGTDVIAFSSRGADEPHVARLFRIADGQPLMTARLFSSRLLLQENRTFIEFLDSDLNRGLLDDKGTLLIPARYSQIEYAGEGIWRVTARNQTGGEAIGLYDSSGHMLSEPAFSQIGEFHGGAAVARTADYKNVLVNESGSILASFDQLFPEIAANAGSGDMSVQAVDLCYVSDPAAEPEDQPVRTAGRGLLCSNRELSERSRVALGAYYQAQANACDPTPLLPLAQQYEEGIARARDNQEVAAVIDGFERSVRATAAQCHDHLEPLPAGNPVPEALKSTLKRQILASSLASTEIAVGESDYSLHFTKIKRGKQTWIVASYQCMNCSGYAASPFWIFVPDVGGKWRIVLSNEEGNLAWLVTRNTTMLGVVSISMQNAGQGQSTFYRLRGKGFVSTLECDEFSGAGDAWLRVCSPASASVSR